MHNRSTRIVIFRAKLPGVLIAAAFILLAAVLIVYVPGFLNERDGQDYVAMGRSRLSSTIESAPKSVVDLDNTEGKTIEPSLILGASEAEEGANAHSLFLASPLACIVLNDSLYICDRLNNGIIVADTNGRLIRTLGRLGKGPGEFQEPRDIIRNRDKIYVYDSGNSRVQIFSNRFVYLRSILAFLRINETMGATEKYLFIPGAPGDSGAVRVFEASEPWRFMQFFMPTLVPPGQQPLVMNTVRVATNSEGFVAAGYNHLPYVFIFDPELKLSATLQFVGKAVRKLSEPVPGLDSPGRAPMWNFIGCLIMLSDRSIILGTEWTIYHIKLTGSNYIVKRRFELQRGKTKQELSKTVMRNAYLSGNKLFVFDGFPRIFCYRIELD